MVFKSVPEEQNSAVQKILAEAQRVQALVARLTPTLTPAPAGTDMTSVQVAAIYSLFSMNFLQTFQKHIQSLHQRTDKVRTGTQSHTQADESGGTTVSTAMNGFGSLAQTLATPNFAPQSSPATHAMTEHVHTNTVVTGGSGGSGGGLRAATPAAASQPMQPYGSGNPGGGDGGQPPVPVENQTTAHNNASNSSFGYGGMRGMGLVGALAAARQTLNKRQRDAAALLASSSDDDADRDFDTDVAEPSSVGGPAHDYSTDHTTSAVADTVAPPPVPLPGEFVPIDESDEAEDSYEPYPYYPSQPAGH